MVDRKTVTTWATICVTCVSGFEGLRQVAYRDPIGIPTACFGETKNIKLGDSFTKEQCEEMLGTRVLEYGKGVDRCIHHELPPTRKAAYTSAAYNMGVETFCKSSMARKENAGDVQGACDALLLYNKARKAGILITLPGLTNRRKAERDLCLQTS